MRITAVYVSAGHFRDTAYKAIYARESYRKKNQKEPTVQEILTEIGIAKEDIVCFGCNPDTDESAGTGLNDGGDALYVMDQISDHTNKEEKWVEDLSLEEAMEHLDERESYIITLRFFRGEPRWKWQEMRISQAQVSRLEKTQVA